MKVAVIGTGFVGLAHAAVTARCNTVYAYDINSEKLDAFKSLDEDKINSYVNEDGLPKLIKQNYGKSLFFTNDLNEALNNVDAIFMCLPTPSKGGSSETAFETDLSFLETASINVCSVLKERENKKRVVIVNKSTVPVGTAAFLEDIIQKSGCTNVGAASNPEFLPEGKAIEASIKPDRIVVGAYNFNDFAILREVYSPFTGNPNTTYLETTPETSELIKYTANTFLLTKISFWNSVASRAAELFPNINLEDLRRGVGGDKRIGHWGFYASNGAGGSCFGKDIRSLIIQLRKKNIDTNLLETVNKINEYQKGYLFDRAVDEAGFNFNEKTIALLGTAFKEETNDMREASSLVAVEKLIGKGVKAINVYDPIATAEAKKYFDPKKNRYFDCLHYFENITNAIKGTDGLYICSDWQEFRRVPDVIEELKIDLPYLVIDGRRIIANPKKLIDKGFTHLGVGYRVSNSLKK